jgi:osmotically-inducible protein OsmY
MARKVAFNLLFIATMAALLSPIVLAGSRASRWDAAIQAELQSIVAGRAQFANVTLTVEDGIVSLRGSVARLADGRQLESELQATQHVAGLRSELQVSSYLPDEQIQQRVALPLAQPALKGVRLQVQNGIATLEGTVASLADRIAAVYILENTEGVKAVEDRIVVTGT